MYNLNNIQNVKIKLLTIFLFIIFTCISISGLLWNNINLENSAFVNLILDLRLPRYLAALLIGGMLGICGSLMQNATHNPLVEPNILGVSSASSLLSIIFLLMNFNVMLGGILGALLAIILLNYINFNIILNKKIVLSNIEYSTTVIILKGVMLNTICGACITLILQLTPSEQIPSLLFWLMGDLTYITWKNVLYLLSIFLILFIWCIYNKNKLNYLWLDSYKAYTFGISLPKLHYIIYILVSITIGVITSQAGSIGFIALISPYIAKYILQLNNKIQFSIYQQIIYSCIIGALILSIADNIAKYIIYPAQISVGIINAFLGVPIFWKILHVLYKKS